MRILFAIDGSACSKAAIRAARQMKCPGGTQIKVVSVVDFFEPLPALEGAKEKEIAAADLLVQRTVSELRETHPNAEIEGAVLDGYASDEILHFAGEWPADLIMVGSHGRTGADTFFLGSVSRTILLNAKCAVRIVRESSEEHQKSAACNVILALDESDHSRNLVDHALLFPWPEKTKFRCVNVVKELVNEYFLNLDVGIVDAKLYEHYIQKKSLAESWLAAEAERINKHFGRDVATGETIVGDPRAKILELALKWPADLVMLGSHGRHGIERLVLGSVSETVATHAHCSVEVTRVPAFHKERIHVIV